jgi:hypothetical protein
MATSSSSNNIKKPGKKLGTVAKEVHQWYLGFTSIGGLSQFSSNDLTISKIFWFILFVIGAVLTVIGFVTVVIDILAYQVTISVTLEQRASLPFPGVTLCNQNRVHCGNLYDMVQDCESNNDTCTTRRDVLCQLYQIGGCNVSITAAYMFHYGITPDKVCDGLDFISKYPNG